ncbi:hypothetical protein [Gynuella sunshinyii]|uniref:Secreted protein n=1 Tax=Gynuella sunshinyii YC6258 TaxID=1445510 RepID=A0A0C5W5S4_9GAMM|nr:hypothetical protein [Gynuella sunshinyii]AJQ97954.1 hypothetical Protein YC6258_05930 [Gynuella sunshinyii YC6258]
MKKQLFMLSVLVLFCSGKTVAQEMINCTSVANVKTRCVVDQQAELGYEITSMIGGREITESTEFSVDYRLDCRNSPIYLSLVSGTGSATLINDGSVHTAVVYGKGTLKVVDTNPSDTYRRYYQQVCSLDVQDVRVLPSQDAIDQWTYDAIDQADDIEKSLTLYELAAEYVHYRDWSVNKTELLLTEVNRKVTYFENRCNRGDATACSAKAHFQVVANSLQARLDSDPSTLPPVGAESDVLLNYYKEDLIAEVAIGREMLERFEEWEIAVNEELDDILLQIPAEIGG